MIARWSGSSICTVRDWCNNADFRFLLHQSFEYDDRAKELGVGIEDFDAQVNAIETVGCPKRAKLHATELQRLLAEGHRTISIYVWTELQKIPAGVYVNENSGDYSDADIHITVDTNPNITTGTEYDGRMAIRYGFG